MSVASPSVVRPRESGAGSAWHERAARLFEELRVPCSRMVHRAYGATFSDHEVEDVYASAWASTLRTLEPRQGEMDDEEVRRYLFTAVAHQARKEVRRRKRRPVAPLERALSVADQSAEPEEQAETAERSRIARDLLSSLPRRRRAVLLLRYGWGLEPAQVCELIDGLSPRAYRKEITRGIDELTERMRKLERGDWCADREGVLKAFAAGLADPEQERQAQLHLAHCRPCSEFVGKLSGHLHDIGSAAAVPALDLADDGSLAVPDRLADLAERARDSAAGLFSKGGAVAGDGATSALPATAPRGAGAVGAGLVAKLAGVGAAGKAALACVTGGVATVCVVAAIGPLDVRQAPRADQAAGAREQPARIARIEGILPSQVDSLDTPESPSPPPTAEPPPPAPEPEPAPTEPAPTEEPAVPPSVQQFDVAPPPATTGGDSGDGGGGRGGAAAQEFGP